MRLLLVLLIILFVAGIAITTIGIHFYGDKSQAWVIGMIALIIASVLLNLLEPAFDRSLRP